jgi:hypothetical protein
VHHTLDRGEQVEGRLGSFCTGRALDDEAVQTDLSWRLAGERSSGSTVLRGYAVAGGPALSPAGRSQAGGARYGASYRAPWDYPRLHRQQALSLQFLARELAGAADSLGFLSRFLLRGLFIVPAELHFAKEAFALHLLFQHFKGLIDIVITNEDLQTIFLFNRWVNGQTTQDLSYGGTYLI